MNYVAFSGGADSTALAILLHERGEEFELVFCDTGAELPETYETITRVAKALRRKLRVLSGGSFYQWLVHYGWMLPAPFCRWCTRVLKQVPQERFFKADDVVAIGIRADEAHRGLSEHKYAVRRPLVDAGMTKRDVLELCRKYDLLNPAYAWRTNVSCFCCPFQRKSDWRGLLRVHPYLYALAEQWEQRCMDWADEHREDGVHPRFTWNEAFTLRQLREADESQLRLFPEPEEEACSICRW